MVNIKIIILVYLLVGILRLVFEFFKPIPRQPIYLIKYNFLLMLISVLFWPLVIIIRIRSEWLIKKPKIETNYEVIEKIKNCDVNLSETNFKIRCPNCGHYGLCIIDKEKVERNKNLYKQLIHKSFSLALKFGPENIPLLCRKCGHEFVKDDADIWESVSTKFGNKIAIIEYHRKQKEIENEINETEES